MREHPEWLTTLCNTCKAAETAEQSEPGMPEFTFGSVRLFDASPSVNMKAFLNRGLIEPSPRGPGGKDWYVMPYRRVIEKAIRAVESTVSTRRNES